MTDTGAGVQPPRPVYLDLETDSRVPFSRKEEARILSWALVNEEGRAKAGVLEEDSNMAEEDLVGRLLEALTNYDQVIAWNGGELRRRDLAFKDGFDFPVLKARSEYHRLILDVRRKLWLDHLVLFRRMNQHAAESGDEKQSMKLNDIASKVLKEKKDEFDASKTYEEWKAGGERRRRLVHYNVQDTRLLQKLEAKTGYIRLFSTLCEACNVFGDTQGLNPTEQMDGFLLRLGRERGIRFPTKKYHDENEGKFKGAYVMEPKAHGIERGVHVCDFKSLYPSIIITWNMSPETKTNGPVNGPIPEGMCRSPLTGICFSTEKEGILPTALRELLRLRVEWQKKQASLPPGTDEWHDAGRKSNAYKVAANSFYGVIGSPYSRYFDRAVAESVTQNGKWLIQRTIGEAERTGGAWKMKAIYADTDSCFVKGANRQSFGDFVKWCNKDLYPEELKKIGCKENLIELAYEKEFASIVFVSAKRYVGRYAHYKGKEATKESRPEVKGLEYKRGDAALLARRLQEQVINLLVSGEENLAVYHVTLGRSRDYILNETLPIEEVRLSKGLSKRLRDYAIKVKKDGKAASQPPHVTVARILEERGQEVGEGTRIEYLVTDGMSSPAQVIPAADYDGTNFDRYYLWESLVFPPSERLLAAAFPEHDWARWGKVRPARPGKRGRVLAGQGSLFEGGAPATGMRIPVRSKGSFFHVILDSKKKPSMAEVHSVLKTHASGPCPVRIVIRTDKGEAELATLVSVEPTDALVEALLECPGVVHAGAA